MKCYPSGKSLSVDSFAWASSEIGVFVSYLMIFHELGLQLHFGCSQPSFIILALCSKCNSFQFQFICQLFTATILQDFGQYMAPAVVKELLETQDRSYRTTLHIFGEDMKEEL